MRVSERIHSNLPPAEDKRLVPGTGPAKSASPSILPSQSDPFTTRQSSTPSSRNVREAGPMPPRSPENPALDTYLRAQQVSTPPTAESLAHDFAKGWLMKHEVSDDPDDIHYTYTNSDDFSGGTYLGPSLTEIAMRNMQDIREGAYNNGGQQAVGPFLMPEQSFGKLMVYPKGKTDEPGQPVTKFTLSEFQGAVWDKDIYTWESAKFGEYFANNSTSLEILSRGNYLRSVDNQLNVASLTAQGAAMARQAAGLAPDRSWSQLSRKDVEGRHDPLGGVTVSPLKIRESVSDSALIIKDGQGDRRVLYLPGNSAPFHEFGNEQAMNQWLAEQARDPAKRAQLVNYFPVAGRDGAAQLTVPPQGGQDLSRSVAEVPKVSLDDFLKERGEISLSGDPGRFVTTGEPLSGDIFQQGLDRLKERTVSDQNETIISDGTYARHEAGEVAGEIGAILGPVSVFVPELVPLVMAAGAVQAGTGLSQYVNGHTQEERQEGIQNMVFGGLNAVPGRVSGAAKDGEELAGDLTHGVQEPPVPEAKIEPKEEKPAPSGPVDTASDLPRPANVDSNQLIDTGGGIYVGKDGGQYIKIDSNTYRAMQDRQTGRWKVVDPDNPYAFYGGTYVRRNEKGDWVPVEGPGLKGGGPAQSRRAQNVPGLTGNDIDLQNWLNLEAKAKGLRPYTVSEIREKDVREPVPSLVYRTHRDPGATPESVAQHGLRRAPGAVPLGDAYLAAIIKHTARTSGSGGEVMSLSGKLDVSERFYKKGENHLFEIDTTQAPGQFRSTTDIILRDGVRLAKAGLITKATLVNAVDLVMRTGEHEIFYVGGDIPPSMVKLVK